MSTCEAAGSGVEGSAPEWPYVAKVSDFGLSVKIDEFFGHVSNAHHGTPFYMAPEVTRAGFLSMAADSYSFGAPVSLPCSLFASLEASPEYDVKGGGRLCLSGMHDMRLLLPTGWCWGPSLVSLVAVAALVLLIRALN